ncbi:S8/S53 family peptidase [Nocardioides sp. CN2-186]|uniref:S8 family peptidase n=1 Tax=Nocardioides tweenelious TaxID=3156607 RepID=UPI0032B32164
MHLRSVLAGATAFALVGLTGAPAQAVTVTCAESSPDGGGEAGISSAPFDQLGLERAQQQVDDFAPPAGEPVRVAVLDSGVGAANADSIPVRKTVSYMPPDADVSYFLGTEVAGLIAGADDGSRHVGFAPGTEIVDVRTYVDPTADDKELRPTSGTTARALRWVAQNARDLNIKVATIAFPVSNGPGLRAAVEEAQAKDVVVVAATGDRVAPTDGTEPTAEELRADDAATDSYPAAFPHVVAVNSTGDGYPDDPMSIVRANSRTTVAAPTYHGVSYGLSGSSCAVDPISTGAAAAEVSGVVALLWQMYRHDSAKQIIARLVNTANGTTDDPTPLTGAGVVQPYEALTRPLDPGAKGDVERTVTQADVHPEATAPVPAPDVLAETRDDAVWWGLIGGGLLVVALLLRPVLARRRS